PDVSLGEVACNAEFCRAEIYGSVKEDLQKGNGSVEQDVAGDDGSVERDEQRKNGKTLMVAVEAKGLRFCMFDRDATHTKAGCYFGRDESWTAPSF
ncbi:MAG: hypothetical protein JW940_38735, partial [Polyangiaceae bacterium]|nr:hypothetical protein [Polyangiaceae bacterium]